MQKLVSASLMCSKNLLNLEQTINELENAGVDMFHLDAMDGHFVNNITFGPDIMNAIRKIVHAPCDYHLMVEYPNSFLSNLDLSTNDIVTIHQEIDEFDDSLNFLEIMKEVKGINIGVALNPSTDFERLKYQLNDIDMILVMLVQPGFAGRPIVESALSKPLELRKWLDSLGYTNIKISVDGGVSIDRAHKLAKDKAADIFVGGTSGLFMKDIPLKKSLQMLKSAINC